MRLFIRPVNKLNFIIGAAFITEWGLGGSAFRGGAAVTGTGCRWLRRGGGRRGSWLRRCPEPVPQCHKSVIKFLVDFLPGVLKDVDLNLDVALLHLHLTVKPALWLLHDRLLPLYQASHLALSSLSTLLTSPH